VALTLALEAGNGGALVFSNSGHRSLLKTDLRPNGIELAPERGGPFTISAKVFLVFVVGITCSQELSSSLENKLNSLFQLGPPFPQR